MRPGTVRLAPTHHETRRRGGESPAMSLLGSALPDLRVRRRRAELMDDPDLDPRRHLRALGALSRVNRVSLAAWRLGRQVGALRSRVDGPVRILDVACGGGDILLRVAAAARRRAWDVALDGCDLSERALDAARRSARTAGHPDDPSDEGVSLRFFRLDVLRDSMPEGYDLVTSSLFLHHLEWDDATLLLRRMAEASRHRLFVQDLRRTRLGYVLAWLGLHTLTRSDVARVDGLRSVEAAFTVAEARRLCTESALHGAVVTTGWPQRLTISWDRMVVA